jgi:Flp pilus assembly protein TadD
MNNKNKGAEDRLLVQLRQVKRMLVISLMLLVCFAATTAYFVVERVKEKRQQPEISYFAQSDALTRKADWKGTLALAKKRQQTHPSDADAYWFEGVAQFNHEKWAEAITAINRAVELNPEKWRPMSSAWLIPAKKKLWEQTRQQ